MNLVSCFFCRGGDGGGDGSILFIRRRENNSMTREVPRKWKTFPVDLFNYRSKISSIQFLALTVCCVWGWHDTISLLAKNPFHKCWCWCCCRQPICTTHFACFFFAEAIFLPCYTIVMSALEVDCAWVIFRETEETNKRFYSIIMKSFFLLSRVSSVMCYLFRELQRGTTAQVTTTPTKMKIELNIATDWRTEKKLRHKT